MRQGFFHLSSQERGAVIIANKAKYFAMRYHQW